MSALVLEEGAQLTECSLCEQRFTNVSGGRAPRRLPCLCHSVVCHACANVTVVPAKECPFCKTELHQKTASEFELSLETLKFLKWLWAEYEIAKLHDLADQVCQCVRHTEHQGVQKIRDSEFNAVMGLTKTADESNTEDNALAAEKDDVTHHAQEVAILAAMKDLTTSKLDSAPKSKSLENLDSFVDDVVVKERKSKLKLKKKSEGGSVTSLGSSDSKNKKKRSLKKAGKAESAVEVKVEVEAEVEPEVVDFLHVAWTPLASKCIFMTVLEDGRIGISFQQLSKVVFYRLDHSSCLVKDAQLTHPKMKRPMSLCAASDNRLLVSCNAKIFHGILLFSLSTGELLIQCGDAKGVELGFFNLPLGVSVCPKNELVYVADSSNHRVQVLQLNKRLAPLSEFGLGELALPTDAYVHADRVYVPGKHGLAAFQQGGLHRLTRLHKSASGAQSTPTDRGGTLQTGSVTGQTDRDEVSLKDPGCCAVDGRWKQPVVFVTDPDRHLVAALDFHSSQHSRNQPRILGELQLRESEFPCAMVVQDDKLMLTVADGDDWRFHVFRIIANAATV